MGRLIQNGIRIALSALCLSAILHVEPMLAQDTVLDRVVAVVNNRAILSSDLDNEIQISILEAGAIKPEEITRQRALELLISRTLIQQQIRQTEENASMPAQDEINKRIEEIRKELPNCVHEDCVSDAGWKEFLAKHGLTPARVENYLRIRLEILNFIELRFRQGVHITQEEISEYYNKTLLPQYPTSATKSALNDVAPRIEEILLQQRVSALFSDWLKSLREQGDIEVLDPSLESAGKEKSP